MPANKPQTILFIVPSAYLLGGVQIWLDYLIEGLNRSGFKCICGAVDGYYHKADAYFERYSFTHKIKISNPTGTQFGRVKNLTSAILNSDADLVVCVNIADVYPAVHRARQIRQKQIKVMATLHGFGSDYFADLSFFEPLIDAVLVTNKLTALALQKMTTVAPSKLYYSPYGVEFDDQIVSRERSPGRMRILYSGRIENQQKRCSDLIPIINRLHSDGVNFELVCAGDGAYREELENTLLDFVPADIITFTGTLKHDDLIGRILPSCDVLIITSEWETGPIVAWEAMSKGVVVVSSRYLGSDQEAALVDGVNCLLFDIGDTMKAAEHILSLQQNSLYNDLRAAGRELVRSRYTREKSVATFASNVKQILNTEQTRERFDEHRFRYRKSGLIEQILGHKIGDFIRKICNKPAFLRSAGDEWPHSLTPPDNDEQQFMQRLINLSSNDT